MIVIDDPVYLEITISGDMTFIVVIDAEDDPAQFALGLSNKINKSVDFNVIPFLNGGT